jgi:hypothetical protein
VPQNILIQDFEISKKIYSALMEGYFYDGAGKLRLKYSKQNALSFLELWNEKNEDLVFGASYQDNEEILLEEIIHLGPGIVEFSALSLEKEAALIADEVRQIRDEEEVNISIFYRESCCKLLPVFDDPEIMN